MIHTQLNDFDLPTFGRNVGYITPRTHSCEIVDQDCLKYVLNIAKETRKNEDNWHAWARWAELRTYMLGERQRDITLVHSLPVAISTIHKKAYSSSDTCKLSTTLHRFLGRPLWYGLNFITLFYFQWGGSDTMWDLKMDLACRKEQVTRFSSL